MVFLFSMAHLGQQQGDDDVLCAGTEKMQMKMLLQHYLSNLLK